MAFGSRSGNGYLVHLEDGRLSLVEYDFRGLEEQKDRRDFWQSIRRWPQGAIKWPQDGQVLNLFLDLDDYFFGQGGACQLRNSSGVLGKPTPSPMDLRDVSRSRASHAGGSARPRGQAHITSSSSLPCFLT